MKNPFRYGAKVTGGSFYDRREIKASMMNVLDGGNNVVLYGPRRYGKSSLVAEMIEELRKKGTVCVYLNMMNVASLGDFVLAYSKAVYDQFAPTAGALKNIAGLFKRVRPALALNEEGRPELTLSFASGAVGAAELREVFALPEKLRVKGQSVVIVIDEFQEVAELGLKGRFEQIMRSVIEEHQDVAYVFLGSKTHMLKRMFAAPSRPFYRSAQTFSLNLPPEDESRQFLVEKFRSVGLSLDECAADLIVKRTGNVPYYLQALGSWVFRVTSERGGKVVREADVQMGFESLLAAESELFENLFRSLPESQRLVARAIARESVATFTEDYRTRHFLPSLSTVGTAVRRLISDSRIDIVDGKYRHMDPLFAEYLSRQRKAG